MDILQPVAVLEARMPMFSGTGRFSGKGGKVEPPCVKVGDQAWHHRHRHTYRIG